MRDKAIIVKLAEHLLTSLDELTQNRTGTDFSEGEITAYAECLELLSESKKLKRYNLTEIEKKYPLI